MPVDSCLARSLSLFVMRGLRVLPRFAMNLLMTNIWLVMSLVDRTFESFVIDRLAMIYSTAVKNLIGSLRRNDEMSIEPFSIESWLAGLESLSNERFASSIAFSYFLRLTSAVLIISMDFAILVAFSIYPVTSTMFLIFKVYFGSLYCWM
jgi:hypothetical protein